MNTGSVHLVVGCARCPASFPCNQPTVVEDGLTRFQIAEPDFDADTAVRRLASVPARVSVPRGWTWVGPWGDLKLLCPRCYETAAV